MERKSLFFLAPRQLELREEAMRELRDAELLVKTELSAISAGTEMLLYRGELPAAAESQGDKISSHLAYPLSYGYAAVGRVVETGPSAEPGWQGRLVFGFQPHSSHFIVSSEEVIRVPDGLAAEEAVFLPNMETAVNLVQDSAPLLGERVLVLGQGVVGLLTAALLREFPLHYLVTADRYANRRSASAALGVAAALDPAEVGFREQASQIAGNSHAGYDLVLELTGNPAALNAAIDLTAFSGRIVVGSWYGSKPATLELGGRYHRSRITMIASQVSTIAPHLVGRWDKERRFAVAWDALRRIRPSRWITRRIPISAADEAYRLLDESPDETIQLVFTYS